MSVLMLRVRKVRRLIISKTRPGVPLTICTPWSSLRTSSPMDRPPMHACTCTFMKLPSASATFSVWQASSRVGDSTKACTSRVDVSSIWHSASEIIDVLPVPDCACAMTSRPEQMGMMARCWIAEGFSKPYEYSPRSRSSRIPMESNVLTTVTPLVVSKLMFSSLSKSIDVSLPSPMLAPAPWHCAHVNCPPEIRNCRLRAVF
mmetsp:Transcript_44215/g.70974  ORF Transcript_44215/g.70974 Transcript_44215/m.70974 type:complete len:203 (+) Transcript_44215:1042-1650(+)